MTEKNPDSSFQALEALWPAQVSSLMLDALPFGLILTDAGLHIQQVNQWVAENFSVQPEEIRGQLLNEAFPELEKRNLLQAYQLVLQTAMPLTLSTRIHKYYLPVPMRLPGAMQYMPQSTVITPLVRDGKVLGTLTVITNVTVRLSTEQALQREVEKLSVLHEIDRALATLDLNHCLEVIVEHTRSLFQADQVLLYLYQGDRLDIAAARPGETHPQNLTENVLQASNQRKSLLKTHLQANDIQAEMVAPLLEQTSCLGVLAVRTCQQLTYSQDDLHLLELLASRAAVAISNARLHHNQQIEHQFAQTLQQISLALTADLNLGSVLDTLFSSMKQVIPYDSASLLLVEGDQVRIARHNGYDQYIGHLNGNATFSLESVQNLREMAGDLRPRVVPDTWSDPIWQVLETSRHIRSWVGAPIVVRNKLLGFLSLDRVVPDFYTQKMADQLAAFAAHAAMALENARMYEEQQRLATTDGLTGIANRRSFDAALRYELERGARFGHSTALVMIDIDNFKKFNDSYGHPAGDALLRKFARILRENLRLIDIPARYGGEEFALILPETHQDAAFQTAERIRRLVARMHGEVSVYKEPQHAPVTISLGIALAPEHAETLEQLISAADQALYYGKQQGKNRSCLFRQTQSNPAMLSH